MNVSPTATLLALLDEPVLRSVPEGAGPYPGEIIARQDRPATKVAAEDAASGDLWRAEGEHVAVILDVLRTRNGHAVVLPDFTRSIIDLAATRAAGGQAFRAGEIVTLGVSVLRGTVAELAGHGIPLCHGEWWLDEDGTPQFVHGGAGATADEAAVRVLHALAESCESDAASAAALDRAARTLADLERLPTSAPSIEAELFGLAAAEPVGTQALARRGRSASEPPAAVPMPERPAWQRLADAADAGVAEMVSQAVTGAWRVLRRRGSGQRRHRRGTVWVALACGALVLAAGLLWPTGEQENPLPPASSAGVASPAPPDPSLDPPASADDDVVGAVGGLLDAAGECAGKTECLGPLFDDDAALLQDRNDVRWDGAAFADGASRRLTLLDDVGGLVLVRADDATGVRPSQVVAAVRGENEWVLRDIHDVAQHPG